MSYRVFSRRIHSSANRQVGHRVLRLERLEDRQLLSVAPGISGSLSNAAQHAAMAGDAVAPIDTAASGPTITGVVVSTALREITWNAADSGGVTSSSLTIDGAAVSKIYGPYTAPPGVNYAGVYGPLSTGNHTYVITATDGAGGTSHYTGTFSVAGPTISGVSLSTTQSMITWNAASADGVTSSNLTIDGNLVSNVYGPYTAAVGVNYAGFYGGLSLGNHTYVITATGSGGNSSQYTGTLNVVAPTINGVVVCTTAGAITWNAVTSDGVSSTSLVIDGGTTALVAGPYVAAAGLNYSGRYGVQTHGSHSYVITVTDNGGNSSQLSGTFSVGGPTINGVVASEAQGVITWNTAAYDGVTSSSITIDGVTLTKTGGPYPAVSGVNYAGLFGTLSSGSHTFVITSTDTDGNSSQYTGTLAPGPTIGGVVVSTTQGVFTWNAAASDGVGGSGLTVDGVIIQNVHGPYLATNGFNYAWAYGALGSGSHTYVITAVDNIGNTSQLTGTFAI